MSVPTKIFLSNHQFAKSSDAIWLNYSEQVGGGGGGKFYHGTSSLLEYF